MTFENKLSNRKQASITDSTSYIALLANQNTLHFSFIENANGSSGSPPIHCFVLFYCLNLQVQFDKLYLWTLKNSTPEDQTER